MLWGLEREGLRLKNGQLSQSSLNSAVFIDHPSGNILPDFCDTQVEFVTPPRESWEQAFEDLKALHSHYFTLHPGEELWPESLPPPLGHWQNPGLSASNGEKQAVEWAYRQHLSQRYQLSTLLTSGIHLNVSFGQDDPLPIAQRIWSELDLWIKVFGYSPYGEYLKSYRMSKKGYHNNLCCQRYPTMSSFETYTQEWERLLINCCANALMRKSELYAPLRIKEADYAIQGQGAPPLYLELRIFDLQGGPFGLDESHLMMAEFLLAFSKKRPWVGEWGQSQQRSGLEKLDFTAKTGNFLEGKFCAHWVEKAGEFLKEQKSNPRFFIYERGFQLIVDRLCSPSPDLIPFREKCCL